MKYLFRSKRFRRNLYQWIVMYVGVMFLFQTVITYSKYISQMGSLDEARVAKFHVDVAYDQCTNFVTETICDSSSSCSPVSVCNSGYYRPTSEIPYYFSVDTSELEVKSLFLLNVSVHSDFEVLSFENLTNSTDLTSSFLDNKAILTTTMAAGSGKKTYYKIVVRYRGDVSKFDKEKQYGQLVHVGYSANQIKD